MELREILEFFIVTPPDVLAAKALLYFGWVPIVAVVIWGFVQIWIDNKQGQYLSRVKFVYLSISVPPASVQTPKGMENFFATMIGTKSSITWKEKWLDGKFHMFISCEIVSIGGKIQFVMRVQKKDQDMLEAALYAQYPDAQIVEIEDYAKDWPETFPNDEMNSWGGQMVLKKPSYHPIKTYVDFEHQGEKDLRFKDPLYVILEQLGKMRPNEIYAIQIIIMPMDEQDAWRKPGIKFLEEKLGKGKVDKKSNVIGDALMWAPAEMMNQITGGMLGIGGGGEEAKKDDWAMFRLTPQEQDQVKDVTRKLSKYGWLAKIRFVYLSPNDAYRKGSIASISKGMFAQFANLNDNYLGLFDPATPKDDYFWMEWQMPAKQKRIVRGFKQRNFSLGADPFVLNTEELATLFHFPAGDARVPAYPSAASKLSEAPAGLTTIPEAEITIPLSKDDKPAMVRTPEKLVVPMPKPPVPLDPSFDERKPVPKMQIESPSNEDVPPNLPI